jgi:hypothetical protein
VWWQVVVGHPLILAEYECWRAFMQFCHEHDAYRGVACPPLKLGNVEADGEWDGEWGEEYEDALFLQRAVELSGLGSAEQSFPTDLYTYYNDDPEWRVIL